jgi:hypothetical protein
VSTPNRFTRTFVAAPEHIDELGHVNNTVWVQWIQDMATAHWDAVARPEDSAAFFWVVVRHEIDYRGNVLEGESVTSTTWAPSRCGVWNSPTRPASGLSARRPPGRCSTAPLVDWRGSGLKFWNPFAPIRRRDFRAYAAAQAAR